MAKQQKISAQAPRRMATADLEQRASQMRLGGASYDAIAKALDVSREGARKAVKRAWERTRELSEEAAAEIVAREIDRLDRLTLALWTDAVGGDQGAVDRVLRIMERRAKLLGLDIATSNGVKVSQDGNGNTVVEVWMPPNEL